MENKNANKEQIKKMILEIFDIENRTLNIREVTELLKKNFKVIKSQPTIKNYLKELIKEGHIEGN